MMAFNLSCLSIFQLKLFKGVWRNFVLFVLACMLVPVLSRVTIGGKQRDSVQEFVVKYLSEGHNGIGGHSIGSRPFVRKSELSHSAILATLSVIIDIYRVEVVLCILMLLIFSFNDCT